MFQGRDSRPARMFHVSQRRVAAETVLETPLPHLQALMTTAFLQTHSLQGSIWLSLVQKQVILLRCS